MTEPSVPSVWCAMPSPPLPSWTPAYAKRRRRIAPRRFRSGAERTPSGRQAPRPRPGAVAPCLAPVPPSRSRSIYTSRAGQSIEGRTPGGRGEEKTICRANDPKVSGLAVPK